MSFADLKRNSKSNFEKLNKELDKLNSKGSFSEDERYWKLSVDKSGNGYAVIRFLPAGDGEEIPYVQKWNHGFKGPTGLWYIENCLSTIRKDDPVNEANSILWNSGVESDKDIARERKRKLKFISNILVVKDPENPENEGKVFLFSYGKKLFDKLNDMMNPEFEDENPMNPFDMWEGANFKLKQRKVDGWPNFDKSEFEEPSCINDDDDELEKIYNSCYSLKEEISEDKFKSYDELKAKFDKVVGNDAQSTEKKEELKDERAPVKEEKSKEPEQQPMMEKSGDDDDDDDLAFFKKIAEED